MNDSRKYWDEYYKKTLAPIVPSPFAFFVTNYVKANDSLLEIGSGNGRDAIHFHRLGCCVTAIDRSEEAISSMRCRFPEIKSFAMDMTDIARIGTSFDHVYSRFSLHAIDDEQQNMVLQNLKAVMRKNASLWIEVRSTEDELFGKGEKVGRNAFFYQGHYRRFVELNEILTQLIQNGFNIHYAEKSVGFAPFENSDPVVIRIRAKK